MAEYRIKSFDGSLVTLLYKDHSTSQCLYTTITVEEFISKPLPISLTSTSEISVMQESLPIGSGQNFYLQHALSSIRLQNTNQFLFLFNNDTKKLLTLTLFNVIIVELKWFSLILLLSIQRQSMNGRKQTSGVTQKLSAQKEQKEKDRRSNHATLNLNYS